MLNLFKSNVASYNTLQHRSTQHSVIGQTWQAALWLTTGILAFGSIQGVLSFGNEIHSLATCLERWVAKGHWMGMPALTVSEIHVKFGGKRNLASSSYVLSGSLYRLYVICHYRVRYTMLYNDKLKPTWHVVLAIPRRLRKAVWLPGNVSKVLTETFVVTAELPTKLEVRMEATQQRIRKNHVQQFLM